MKPQSKMPSISREIGLMVDILQSAKWHEYDVMVRAWSIGIWDTFPGFSNVLPVTPREFPEKYGLGWRISTRLFVCCQSNKFNRL